MSIYVMESSDEVKTVKVFSEALPVEMRGSAPEEIGEELDGKNVSTHCVGEKGASNGTAHLLQLVWSTSKYVKICPEMIVIITSES